MLRQLTIKNFVIIENLQVDFFEGMTVLTGETGAGKSIIIDAVGLLVGGRGSTSFIRHGEDKCMLEAEFALDKLPEGLVDVAKDQALDLTDDVLIIQREIYASGRNVCRINGQMVTVSVLASIGRYLVDIQGQNDHQDLMDTQAHLRLLDNYGGPDHQTLLTKYQALYQDYVQARKDLQSLETDEQDLHRRLDILEFQIQDIQEAQLELGEEERLEEELSQLLNFQKIQEALAGAYGVLNSDSSYSALDPIGEALADIESIEELHPDYQQVSEQIQGAFYQLQDATSTLSKLLSDLSFDEERLVELEDRRELIYKLKQKYGQSIEEILAFEKKASQDLASLKNRDIQKSEVEERLKELSGLILDQGRSLSLSRRQVAEELTEAVHGQLKDLYMENARFQVNFSKAEEEISLEDANPRGLDQVEFYIQTNPGEPLRPLVQVASGGELSRLMLALKTVLSQEDLSTIIFDEVDTGVSGRVAQAIADKIYQISKEAQVLCITHLPQVSAIADEHFYISKEIRDGQTHTHIHHLDTEERVDEVARMLAGEELTDSARSAARSLIEGRHT